MSSNKVGGVTLNNKTALVGGIVLGGAAVAAGVYALTRYLQDRYKVVVTDHHGGELVASVLKAHGVPFLFTLIGGHVSPIVVASKVAGIRVIDVRHEATAVFAADAVARLTGVPGVACVTAGPGITNTITAVKNAQMAESPLVLLGGAAATLTKGRGALQDIEQLAVLKPIVKWAATVSTVRDIVPTLRRAFQEAVSGVPGPVFVELPIDVLYPYLEVTASMGLVDRSKVRDVLANPALLPRVIMSDDAAAAGLTVEQFVRSKPRQDTPIFLHKDPARLASSIPAFIRWYLNFKLKEVFGGSMAPLVNPTPTTAAGFAPLPVSVPLPTRSSIATAKRLLMNAKRPVLLLASQALLFDPSNRTKTGVSSPTTLLAAVNDLGIPTFLGGMARGLLGTSHDLFFRQVRKAALQKADVVILAGTVPDFRLDYGRSISRKAKVVAVNRNAASLDMNRGMFWNAEARIQCDPAAFLAQLAGALRSDAHRPSYADWIAELRVDEEKKEAANATKSSEPAFGHDAYASKQLVNPLFLFQHVEKALPPNALLIGDGGDFVATAAYTLRPRGPLSWMDPGAFGTLGVGMGFALGAKLAMPDKEVWLVWGDGSVGYSVAEFDTALRHKLPIIALVGNDAAWSQIERDQVPILGDNVACPLLYTPYEQVAEGYGGAGVVVADNSEAAITAAVHKAQAAARDGTSFLINVLIGKSDFREGSISV